MADSQSTYLLNPWILHLQKLALELKCLLCLNLYDKPMLLPCNHIFCRCCIPSAKLCGSGSQCPLCKHSFVPQDLREAPYMRNLVNIFTSLDSSFSMHMLNSEVRNGGSVQCHIPAQRSSKEPIHSTPSPGNSTSGAASVETMLQRCCSSANPPLRPGIFEHNYPSNVNVGMNQEELSPDSPPSSGASKGVEMDIRDQTAGTCPSKKSLKREVDNAATQGTCQPSDTFCKKQKQTNLNQVEFPQCPSPSTILNQQTSVSTGSATAKTECALNFICAFCKTWKVTQGSGQMHHFANGTQVFGNDAARSNVTHLHQACIEWTPQIYYENDTTIRNVEKELARAEKLKCTCCGLKGAALGCFAKSCRRTYHAPCAYEVQGCRWDAENFLMLCPSHSSLKFPNEKSKKSSAKKALTVKIYDELMNTVLSEPNSWKSSSTVTQNWIFCASSLSADEKSMLVKFANMCGASVTKNWTPEVTHVIAATDANGACSRTLKVLMAILEGRWILKTDWVRACMEQKCPVDEELYEINLDNHGCRDGPRTGRLRALNSAAKLFSGMKFYFNGEFLEKYQCDLEDLIIAGGGTILETKQHLQQQCSSINGELMIPGTTVVVYNDDAVTGKGDESSVLQRQVDAEIVAAQSGSQVIPHTWLLGSIASNRLQPYA